MSPGAVIRAPTWDDLDGLVDLITECDLSDVGVADVGAEELRAEWTEPGFDLARDAWLIVLDERPVGYGYLLARETGSAHAYGFVRPAYRSRGFGAEILRLIEARAREHGGDRLTNYALASDPDVDSLLRSNGYRPVRHYFHLGIDVTGAVLDAPLPGGVEVRPFVPGRDDRRLYDAVVEAFAEEWGYEPHSFEGWKRRHLERPGFEPGLWLVAVDAGEVAGFSLCSIGDGSGFVETLGVRPGWRRRGLGLALLHRSFGLLDARGAARVALNVDGENPTGATRLYERAGMRLLYRFDRYEKALR
jgi:mycothiol synthase